MIELSHHTTVYCNATTSIGASLEWVGQGEESIQKCYYSTTEECCNIINGSVYQKLIQNVSRPLSINESSYVSDISMALLVCNTSLEGGEEIDFIYYCQITNDTSYRQTVTIIILPSSSLGIALPTNAVPISNSTDLWWVVVLVLILLAIVILVTMITIGHLCFINTKKRRSSLALAATQFSTNPMFISSDEKQLHHVKADPMEFPRDRLYFKALIGKCGYMYIVYRHVYLVIVL